MVSRLAVKRLLRCLGFLGNSNAKSTIATLNKSVVIRSAEKFDTEEVLSSQLTQKVAVALERFAGHTASFRS